MNSKRQTNEPRDNRGGMRRRGHYGNSKITVPSVSSVPVTLILLLLTKVAYVALYLGLHLELIISYPHQDSLCEP